MSVFSLLDKLAGRWLDWRTEQWSKRQAIDEGDVELVGWSLSKERGAEITIAHPVIANLAAECTRFLDEHDAKNYVQFEIVPRIDRGQRRIVVTIAFADGEMPAIKAARLEGELNDEKARTAIFEDCLHRALTLWQKQNPEKEFWPDGAVNLAWLFERLTALEAKEPGSESVTETV